MLQFSCPRAVCMQSGQKDARQHPYTLCFQNCDQHFSKRYQESWPESPEDIATDVLDIDCVFRAAFRTKSCERFSRRPTVPLSKTRCQPHQTILHAHHYGYPKIAPGEERILLSVPMFYAVHMCHMCGSTRSGKGDAPLANFYCNRFACPIDGSPPSACSLLLALLGLLVPSYCGHNRAQSTVTKCSRRPQRGGRLEP